MVYRLWTCIIVVLAALVAAPAHAQIIPVERVGSMPGGRARHAAVFAHRQLYVIGGQDGWYAPHYNTVFRAAVDQDGMPGNWVVQSPLPAPRSIIDSTTAVFNNRLYVVGGFNGETEEWARTVFVADIAPYGDLGAWRTLDANPIPGTQLEGMVAVAGVNSLLVMGGMDAATGCTDAVRAAILDGDGTITGWESAPVLPAPLAYGYAGTMGGRVYVWGGTKSPDPTAGLNKRAYSAALQRDGRVGEWQAEPVELAEPFYQSSAAQIGTYFFVYSPHYSNDQFGTEIYWSSVKSGSMGPFGRANIATSAMAFPGVCSNPENNLIYVTGGRPAHSGAGFPDVRLIRMRR